MKQQRTLAWVLGAAFVALAMTAGAWFLGVSPALESASEMNRQADDEAARADQLQIQLTGLKRDFENIEEFRTELAGLKTQIPDARDLTTLNSELSSLSDQAGVFVDSVNTSAPLEVISEATAAPVPTTTTEPGTEEGSTEGATDAAGTTAPAPPAAIGLYALPMQVTIIGSFDETVAYLDLLQTQSTRLYYVVGISATVEQAEGARGIKPAVTAGDLQTVITVWAFVLPETAVADTTDPEAPAELPTPSGQDNPFVTT